jgi:hypothetical protein
VARSLFAAVVFAVGSLFASTASAELTAYDLVLSIDAVQSDAPCTSLSSSFGCVGVGDTFRGRFSVDSAILATDGVNSSAAIYDFFLPFGDAVYATGPENTTLAGFRNPMLGASAPSFRILGGQVVDLIGGVYGSGDIPFIDMSYGSLPSYRFMAYDGPTRAFGNITIATAVPEPETYAMWLLGLGVLLAARRRG